MASANLDFDAAQLPKRFRTTRWSLIAAAADPSSAHAHQALGQLCQVYWYPLYAFIRRKGHSMDEAADLTQEFFARLLENDFLRNVDRKKGKFRSFLMTCCQHFLANERDRARALKRGGGRQFFSFDARDAERRYLGEPSYSLTPERLFERQWALALLERVFSILREEHRSAGKLRLFEALKVVLMGDKPGVRYADWAKKLRTTESALKMAASRLRKRYREVLREEIAQTVSDPASFEEELGILLAALGN